MKEIFAQFGTAVMAAVIAAALIFLFHNLTVLGHTGVGGGVGQILREDSDGLLTETEAETEDGFLSYVEKEGITVEYRENHVIYAGEEFALSDCFDAENADQKSIQLKIINIEDESGNRYFGREEDGESYICLENPGIYTFRLAGTDLTGVLRRVSVKIPVQSALGRA